MSELVEVFVALILSAIAVGGAIYGMRWYRSKDDDEQDEFSVWKG